MVKITGGYQGDLNCTAVHTPSGSLISTDAPKDNQGKGEAFSPTDLVAAAFATCIATTMALVARKQSVDLAGLRYEVTKEMSSGAPRRISRLTVQLWMPAAARQLPAGLMEKTARACPVSESLGPEVEKIIQFHWD